MKIKTEKQKLEELVSYIESRAKCVEEMDYPFQLAFDDIVQVVRRLYKQPHSPTP